MDNNIGNYSLGAGAGYLSYKGATKLTSKMIIPYTNAILDKFQNFSQSEKEAIQKAVYEGYAQSGLKAKKVYLHNVTPDNVDSMYQLFNKKLHKVAYGSKFIQKLKNIGSLTEKQQKELAENISKHLKNKEYKKVWQEIKNVSNGKPVNKLNSTNKIIKMQNNKFKKIFKIISEGRNAFFYRHTKDIMINSEKLGAVAFHEMGHALNATGSKATKALLATRHVTRLFVPVILAIGLLKSKKKDGQEPNGIADKTTTFIKNNAGKLTFAAMASTLAEEGLASIRGGKMAKKVLDPKLLKQVNKFNFLAWTTYIASILALTGTTALAVKIRDKIA